MTLPEGIAAALAAHDIEALVSSVADRLAIPVPEDEPKALPTPYPQAQ